MLSWIIRILLAMAAPIAALLVARDTLNFDVIQTMIAIILIVVFIGIAAMWPLRGPR